MDPKEPQSSYQKNNLQVSWKIFIWARWCKEAGFKKKTEMYKRSHKKIKKKFGLDELAIQNCVPYPRVGTVFIYRCVPVPRLF